MLNEKSALVVVAFFAVILVIDRVEVIYNIATGIAEFCDVGVIVAFGTQIIVISCDGYVVCVAVAVVTAVVAIVTVITIVAVITILTIYIIVAVIIKEKYPVVTAHTGGCAVAITLVAKLVSVVGNEKIVGGIVAVVAKGSFGAYIVAQIVVCVVIRAVICVVVFVGCTFKDCAFFVTASSKREAGKCHKQS